MNQIIVPIPMLMNSESWCEKNHCKCPCHAAPDPWWILPVMTLLTFAGAAIALIALITGISTFMDWIDHDKTLAEAIMTTWRYWVSLMHRIY